MPDICTKPDIHALDIPMDQWTQPFWDGTAAGELLLPRCADCQSFRWPPGPFCPHCQSQHTEWLSAGVPCLYSFTVVRSAAKAEGDAAKIRVPALVEFPEADGVRLLAAVVDTPLDELKIGAALELDWSAAANAMVPVFRVARNLSA